MKHQLNCSPHSRFIGKKKGKMCSLTYFLEFYDEFTFTRRDDSYEITVGTDIVVQTKKENISNTK